MAHPYRIRTGAAFRQADGSLLSGGDVIELDDDVAQAHADKLDPVQTPAQSESATGKEGDA